MVVEVPTELVKAEVFLGSIYLTRPRGPQNERDNQAVFAIDDTDEAAVDPRWRVSGTQLLNGSERLVKEETDRLHLT